MVQQVKWLRDLALLVGVILIVAIPAFALALSPLAPGTALPFVGVVPAIVASLYGLRLAIGAVLSTCALVALVELANPSPVASAVLMVAVGLAIGWCATRGWQTIASAACGWPATLLVGAQFRAPRLGWVMHMPWPVLVPALLVLAGGLWGIVVARVILVRSTREEPHPLERGVALVYGVALAVILGIATFVVSTWFHGTSAGWILLTIFVVARPGISDTVRRVVTRSVGTVAGGVAAALLAFVVPLHAALTVVGLIALVAAIALQVKHANYAVYAFALTASIVLLNSSGTDVIPTDVRRVVFTVVGALLAAMVVGAVKLALVYQEHRIHSRPAK